MSGGLEVARWWLMRVDSLDSSEPDGESYLASTAARYRSDDCHEASCRTFTGALRTTATEALVTGGACVWPEGMHGPHLRCRPVAGAWLTATAVDVVTAEDQPVGSVTATSTGVLARVLSCKDKCWTPTAANNGSCRITGASGTSLSHYASQPTPLGWPGGRWYTG